MLSTIVPDGSTSSPVENILVIQSISDWGALISLNKASHTGRHAEEGESGGSHWPKVTHGGMTAPCGKEPLALHTQEEAEAGQVVEHFTHWWEYRQIGRLQQRA